MNVTQYWSRAMPGLANYGWASLRGDVMGGVIAGFVLIPAALSFGVLSGLGPLAGLYGALAIGVFGALVGGTRGIISGPNANVTIIMAVVATEYAHSITEALATAILAGIIQVIFGLMRFGRYISYVPVSLLDGFFVGVGLLIIATEILPALGLHPVSGGLVGAAMAAPSAVAKVNTDALLVTAVCFMMVLVWRGRLRRIAPDQFMMLVAGTLAGIFWLNGAPVIGEIHVGVPVPQLPEFSVGFFLRVVEPAFMIALISSFGLLIGAMLVDALTGLEEQPNRLLIGHGIGNMAAGLMGGIPGGAANGTLANVRAGGRTLVSNLTVTMMVALTLFSGLSGVVELIPKAVLASILMVTGWRIIDWRLVLRIPRLPFGFSIVMLLTAFIVLFVDITAGIVIGFIVSTFVTSRDLEAVETRRLLSVPRLDREVLGDNADLDDPFDARCGLVRFPDRVSVASAREIVRVVGRDVGGHQIVLFDLSRTEYIDYTAAVMLGRLINSSIASGTRDFVVAGLHDDVADKLNALRLLERIPEGNFAPDVDEAKLIIRPLLEADIARERAVSGGDDQADKQP